MFQCGIKRIYPKSMTCPKIMGRFLWSAVTENRRIHKEPDLRQWPQKPFLQQLVTFKEQQSTQSDDSGKKLRILMFVTFHKGICMLV